MTSIQSAVGMRKKPDEVKQFEQWYYNAPDKDRLAGYANFRNQCPQYDSLLLQNPFIDFRFHGWYGTLGYDTLSSLGFREADVEDAYNVLCAQVPIREACRQEFVPGMLYSNTGDKGQATENIRQPGPCRENGQSYGPETVSSCCGKTEDK